MIDADENVWLTVVAGLRRRGWRITAAVEAGTLGSSDEEHLRYAIDRDWLLLTFDDDFLSLVETEFADLDHAGIVYARQYRRTVGDLVRSIDTALRRNRNRDLTDEIVFV